MKVPKPIEHRGIFTLETARVTVDPAMPYADDAEIRRLVDVMQAGHSVSPVHVLHTGGQRYLLKRGLEAWAAHVVLGRPYIHATVEP